MLTVRKVEEKDIKMLFDWANESQTRQNSLNTKRIEWDEHVAWFHSKLNNPNAFFYIIINNDDEEVGFVRFEKKDFWYTGIVIASKVQGRGVGKEALKISVNEFKKSIDAPIYAQIKKENIGSLKIFEFNSFVCVEFGDVLLYKREA